MSLMWMPPQTTTPPLRVAASAAGTSAPAGAKMRAASSGAAGASSLPPAQAAPELRANAWPAASPGRVKAYTCWPWATASWQMMWAAAPKP